MMCRCAKPSNAAGKRSDKLEPLFNAGASGDTNVGFGPSGEIGLRLGQRGLGGANVGAIGAGL